MGLNITQEEKIFIAKAIGSLLIIGGLLFIVALPFNVTLEPMESALIAYDRMKYIFGFMIIGLVTGIIGILLLILKQNKIYWVFSLILFICGVLGLCFYREISVFFLFIDKNSFVDTVLGRTKMVAYGTILYTTVLFIFSAGLLFLQHKSKIRKRPALKVQGHKVKSKLPSGKEGKKKKKNRS